MKLGLLGSDEQIAGVAEAAAARGDTVVRAADAAAAASEFLDPDSCEAVLVGSEGWDAARAEAVRSLVQTGRPLVVSQPLELAMLWAWELEMIRQDVRGAIVPLLPARLHPFVARLKRTIEAAAAGSGPLGALESLVLERRQADRSRHAVLASLARDGDLVRVLVGEPARVSALGAGAEDAAWNSLTVGFTAPASVPVRWQVAGSGAGTLRISLVCQRGSIEVEAPDDAGRPWRWSQPGLEVEPPVFDPDAAILGVLDAALGRPVPPASGLDAVPPASGLDAVPPASGLDAVPPASGLDAVPPASWPDAARAIELAETVPRSLARGRGIDLHQEEFSELGTFRGTMASLGCGIILAALLLVVLASLVGGIAHEFDWDLGGRLAGAWPIVALVVLGAFLALQVLPLLVAGPGRHE